MTGLRACWWSFAGGGGKKWPVVFCVSLEGTDRRKVVNHT